MIKGRNIPLVNQNLKMSKALDILTKKLGVLIVRDKDNKIAGIITDGQIKDLVKKIQNFIYCQ